MGAGSGALITFLTCVFIVAGGIELEEAEINEVGSGGHIRGFVNLYAIYNWSPFVGRDSRLSSIPAVRLHGRHRLDIRSPIYDGDNQRPPSRLRKSHAHRDNDGAGGRRLPGLRA